MLQMLAHFFISLTSWTCFTHVIPMYVHRKPLNVAGLMHNLLSVYFLTSEYNVLATLNTLGFYTNDIIHILYTNYYTRSECCTYLFHHSISIFFLVANNPNTYPLTILVFRDIELSNLALYSYYYLSKLTKNKCVIAFASAAEALTYGYYRMGLLYHYVSHFSEIKTHYVEQALGAGLYLFGAYFSYILASSAISKLVNIM